MTPQRASQTKDQDGGARGAVPEPLARRVYGEFVEMPDLRVTVADGQRLFGLSEIDCAMVLECLAEFGVLSRLVKGHYGRPAAG